MQFIVHEIQSSKQTVIYKGIRQSDKESVIIKTHVSEIISDLEKKRYRHNFRLGEKLQDDNVIKYYDLLSLDNREAIIEEDFSGIGLENFMRNNRLWVEDFLKIAIQIAAGIDAIHESYIIHKNIKPGNIIINPGTMETKITDFGIATQILHEVQSAISPNKIEGTLAYISPEQTGRINRSVDYRTDHYSMGIVLYLMITGKLPFEYKDPMELVHCHIARQPESPHEIDKDIPMAISNIIMKLMSKSPEERYQSASGIKYDLEKCLSQFREKGAIEDFIPGRQDLPVKFSIPESLYGRESEVALLMKTFDAVSNGKTEMLMVSGYSGVGKSSLVNEIRKPVTLKNGYFTTGKFDQLSRSTAYNAVILAFQNLILEIIGEDADSIKEWKSDFIKALGINAGVIVELIPEIELIMGKQLPVKELGPEETINRFQLVFQDFIKVFASQEHPLVVFLDDLQWADGSTLKLLQYLLSSESIEYTLFIGAYRDNEVSSGHPLLMSMDEIQKVKEIHKLTLLPLEENVVNQIVSDTIHSDRGKSSPLSRLVFKKTEGNPFFVIEYLKNLYHEEYVVFSHEQGEWYFDIEKIKELQVSDNVVDFMLKRLEKLPGETRERLQYASCIGNRFDLKTLSIITERSQQETAEFLWDAVVEGILIPLTGEYNLALTDEEDNNIVYRFQHDRIHQASYMMIEDGEKEEVHLRIGRLMLGSVDEESFDDKIVDIVTQFNKGWRLITDATEKVELVKMNVHAARKAKNSAAFGPAYSFAKINIEIFSDDSWDKYYELTYETYMLLMESAYLSKEFYEAENISRILLEKAKSPMDKARIYSKLLIQYLVIGKMDESIRAGLNGLSLLGISIPEKPSLIRMFKEIFLIKMNMRNRTVDDILNGPIITDPKQDIIQQMLANIIPSAYLTGNDNLMALVVFKQVNLTIRKGIHPEAALPLGIYGGIVLNFMLGDLKSGHEFSELAMKVSNRFPDSGIQYKAIWIYAVGGHWLHDHMRSIPQLLKKVLELAIQNGSLEYMAHPCVHIPQWNPDHTIKDAYNEGAKYLEVIKSTNYQDIWDEAMILMQLRACLMGFTENNLSLSDSFFDENECLERMVSSNFTTGIAVYYWAKLQISYHFGNYRDGEKYLIELDKYKSSINSFPFMIDHVLFSALTHIALYPDLKGIKKRNAFRRIRKDTKLLKKWAGHSPQNFLHLTEMLDAEIARITGNTDDAPSFYERAINSANTNGYLQYEALANELYGRYWLSLGREKVAAIFIQEAGSLYEKWGASLKVSDLNEKYKELIIQTYNKKETSVDDATSTISSFAESLDLMTVIKASQAISSEIDLEKFLTRMIRIISENAGAQKGFLIRKDGDNVFAEAAWRVDSYSNRVFSPAKIEESDDLCRAIVNHVVQSGENFISQNASQEGDYSDNPYIKENQVKSVLCTPFRYKDKIYGALYLENNLVSGAFAENHITLLQVLLAQAAISMENAELFEMSVFFKKFVEESSEGIGWADINGNIQFLNKSLCRMFGEDSPEDVNGKSVFDYYTEETGKFIRQVVFPIVLDQGFWAGELNLQSKKGNKVPSMNSMFLLRNSEGDPLSFANIITDITQRKRSDAALRESEERFRAVFDHTFQFMGLLTTDGILMKANKTSLDFAGIDESEVIGKPFWETVWWSHSGKLQETLRDAIKSASSGEFVRFEAFHPAPDGTIINADFSLKPVKDEKGNTILLIPEGRDITERKQVENLNLVQRDFAFELSTVTNLKEGLELCLDAAIELSNMDSGGIYLFDKNSGSLNMVVYRGFNNREFIDKSLHYDKDSVNVKIIHAGQSLYSSYKNINISPEIDELVIRERLSAIGVLPISHKGKIIGSLHVSSHSLNEVPAFTRVVLESIPAQIGSSIARLQAEEELGHLRNYLKSIVDSMQSVIIGINMNGNITQWNKEAQEATGIGAVDADGKLLTDVLPQLGLEIEKIKKAVQNREVLKQEKIRRKVNGGIGYSDLTLYPLFADGIEGAVIRIDDVTERVRIEEMMIQSEKMLSVGGLAAGMAHEINNPLAGILQNVQVLKNRLIGNIEKNREAALDSGTDLKTIGEYIGKRDIPEIIERIFDSGKRAAKIVDNMLSFSRKSDSQFEDCMVNDLLDKTIELAESDYDLKRKYDFRQIEILRQYDDTLPLVPCERTKIQQVFLNILKNGAESMFAKDVTEMRPLFKLSTVNDDDMVRVEIEDNGTGMDEEVRKRIFEPFYTTKPVGQGTGLGLSVSYFIITENHMGEMSVESEPGKGSKFTIKLPRK
ncbi:PAS domain S-box protein [Spirochaetota bacterium]